MTRNSWWSRIKQSSPALPIAFNWIRQENHRENIGLACRFIDQKDLKMSFFFKELCKFLFFNKCIQKFWIRIDFVVIQEGSAHEGYRGSGAEGSKLFKFQPKKLE